MAKIKTKPAATKSKKVTAANFKAKKGKKPKIKKQISKSPPEDDFTNEEPSEDEALDSSAEENVENEPEATNGDASDSGSDFDMDEELEKPDSEEEQAENGDSEDEAEQHKKSLSKLKETDPEFYNFLRENDKKLLDFNVSDAEEDEADRDNDEEEEVDELHKPDADLEVASDEDDYEDDEEGKPRNNRIITLKMLKVWQNEIQTDKSNKTITTLTQAFHAALKRVSSTEGQEEDDEPAAFRVDGSSVFNGVIQLCVLELGPAIRRFLGITQKNKLAPHKCKKFAKVKRALKGYFVDLLKLLLGVTSSNIQTVLLKHLHYMSPMLVSYPNVTKPLLKRLISLWGSAEDAVRVIAFFCILRITNQNQAGLLDTTLKSMYVTYVKNCKFVGTGTLASINFMRRSMVEMYALDAATSYQHVFLYIRQLAIHLRNAITVKKKENVQSVYNWQFVNSIKLWANLLSTNYHKPQFQQLVYPLVQVCLGTIGLIPTAQYFPLRFHIVQALMDISTSTGVFIPVLPFILEPLTTFDFNKKHQKVSMKPMSFTCVLRLSKSQLQENGFRDTTIDSVYALLLEYLTNQSHSLAFADLSLLAGIQIKLFAKKCKNTTYTRKFKQLLEKIDQNGEFIEKLRKKETFALTDAKRIEGWESQVRTRGTPLTEYYASWSKLSKIKKNKMMTNNDELGDYKLPTLKKSKVGEKKKKSDGPVELFPSDSEDEDTALEKGEKRKRGKRGGKNAKRLARDDGASVEDGGQKDIVEDINAADW